MDNCERIALYSHDALGLGHLRRNLAIAGALADDEPDHAILLVTGAREAGVFPMPDGTDCLALPALTKAGGDYRPRSIGMELDELVELRSEAIASARLSTMSTSGSKTSSALAIAPARSSTSSSSRMRIERAR